MHVTLAHFTMPFNRSLVINSRARKPPQSQPAVAQALGQIVATTGPRNGAAHLPYRGNRIRASKPVLAPGLGEASLSGLPMRSAMAAMMDSPRPLPSEAPPAR